MLLGNEWRKSMSIYNKHVVSIYFTNVSGQVLKVKSFKIKMVHRIRINTTTWQDDGGRVNQLNQFLETEEKWMNNSINDCPWIIDEKEGWEEGKIWLFDCRSALPKTARSLLLALLWEIFLKFSSPQHQPTPLMTTSFPPISSNQPFLKESKLKPLKRSCVRQVALHLTHSSGQEKYLQTKKCFWVFLNFYFFGVSTFSCNLLYLII